MGCLPQVASIAKEIVNRAVDREEALNVACGFKATHVAFALAGGSIGDFSAVVGVLISTVMDGGVGGPAGCGITAQFIGPLDWGRTVVPLIVCERSV